MSSPSALNRSDRTQLKVTRHRPRVWRWGVVLVAVVALHWIAAQWVERARDTFAPEQPVHVPVQVALLTPEKIERSPAGVAAPQAAPAPRKVAPSKPRPHVLTATRPGPAPITAASAPAVASAPEAASAVAATASPASSAVTSSAQAAAAQPAAQPTAQPATQPAAPGVKFSVPPSGELQYDTFYNGVRNQPGTIHWSSDGKTRYEMIVSVPLPFVGTFSYSSHGHIDAFGLAPDQYIEKRGHRAEDVSIFNRTTKQIVFTRTPASLPLTDGAEDRFSMVMQLASLVRGDPAIYKPGVTRQFFVVDNDSGENWPIETIGDETIRTADGYVGARHFMRLPRHDGDRRRIDVWLAPTLGWLPVRIMQTEPNGTEIELVWRGPLTVPTNTDASATVDSANDAATGTPATTPADYAGNGAASGSASGSAANSSANPAANAIAVPAVSPADDQTPSSTLHPVTPAPAAPTTNVSSPSPSPSLTPSAIPSPATPATGAASNPADTSLNPAPSALPEAAPATEKP
jgi:hypothetical protein